LKLNKADSLELVRLCCRALEEKKAGDLRVIDVASLSSITDYLVIATATSDPHVRALRVELEKALDSSKAHIVGIETAGESGWTVMDAFEVMIHLFTSEVRSRYRLEHLWRDGDEVSVDEILGRKKPAPKKAAARKAPAKRKAKAPVKASKPAKKKGGKKSSE
jgi:ribosome-associated protein